MELTFFHNGKHYMGFSVDDAKTANVPNAVIQQAISDMKWEQVRNKRDYLMSQTDWTQIPDAPLTADKKQAYSNYRQSLRDIPQTYSDPDDVVWPEKPTI